MAMFDDFELFGDEAGAPLFPSEMDSMFPVPDSGLAWYPELAAPAGDVAMPEPTFAAIDHHHHQMVTAAASVGGQSLPPTPQSIGDAATFFSPPLPATVMMTMPTTTSTEQAGSLLGTPVSQPANDMDPMDMDVDVDMDASPMMPDLYWQPPAVDSPTEELLMTPQLPEMAAIPSASLFPLYQHHHQQQQQQLQQQQQPVGGVGQLHQFMPMPMPMLTLEHDADVAEEEMELLATTTTTPSPRRRSQPIVPPYAAVQAACGQSDPSVPAPFNWATPFHP